MKRYRITLFLIVSVLLTNAVFAENVEVANKFIKIIVDDNTGRFMLETVAGDPENKDDDNKPLLYKKQPPTSMTTLNIDGQNFIYGSTDGNFKKRPYIRSGMIVSEWSVRGISVIQELSIVKGPNTGNEDSMRITYKIKNENNRSVKIGTRILLDTVLGNKEPVAFGIPGKGNVDKETQFFRDDLPDYWYCFDDYNNPQVRVQGTLTGFGTVRPDKLIFASWDRLFDNQWDFKVDANKDFKRLGTGQYDSAVAIYYNELEVGENKSLYVSTIYGIYGSSFFKSKDMELSFTVPNSLKAPPVNLAASLKNEAIQTLDRVDMELTLPKGFTLKEGETNIIHFFKVKSKEEKKAAWTLSCESAKGDHEVILKVTGWVNQVPQTIVSKKKFNMDFNIEIKVPETNKVAKDLDKDAGITNVVEIEEPVVIKDDPKDVEVVKPKKDTTKVKRRNKFLKDLETTLLEEIGDIDKLVAEINVKYRILMGIYKNAATTNSEFLMDIDYDIKRYELRLLEHENTLSNQKILINMLKE